MEKPNAMNEIIKQVENSVGYLLTLTTFDGKQLDHYFVAKSFPQADMLRALARVKELLIKELEKPFVSPSSNDITLEDIIDASPTTDS